jgi:membrane protein implicated in regulation of membrane protease activity
MFRINLQVLIIIWWIGAAVAASALLTHIYILYIIVGIAGWIIVSVTTALIVYEIKRIKQEDKKKELTEE